MSNKHLKILSLIIVSISLLCATDQWRVFSPTYTPLKSIYSSPPFRKFHKVDIGYNIDSYPGNLSNQIDLSFDEWEDITGYFSFTSGGSDITVETVTGDHSWFGSGPSTANETTGEITSSLIQLNDGTVFGRNPIWTNGIELVGALTMYLDVRNCVTHELGHNLGIAHHYTGTGEPTMATRTLCPSFNTTLKRRSLEVDDTLAVHFLYRNAYLPAEYSSINSAFSVIDDIGEGEITVSSGTYNLSSTITLGDDEIINIESGSVVTLGTSSIILNGGTLNLDDEESINPYICLKNSSSTKGYYPSITSALSSAISGDEIEVKYSTELTADITIGIGKILSIEPNAKVDMKTYKILAGGGSLSIDSDATLYPNVRVVNVTTPYGYYPTLASAFTSANAGNGNKVYVSDTLYVDDAELVPPGVEFTIQSDAYVELESNTSIACATSNTIIIKPGAKIIPDIRRRSSSGVIGLFSNLNTALVSSYSVDIYGEYTSSDHVSVGSNETLIPQSGSELKFASGKYLYVNNGGNLTANGATFTNTSGTWGGIKYQSGSTGSLTGCTIENSTYGVYCNGSSRTINNCEIKNNTSSTNYGVYCNGADPVIINSDISTYYGVWAYNSSPEMRDNRITSDFIGLYCDYYSSPILASIYNGNGNNYFHTGAPMWGVFADDNSNPVLGFTSCGEEAYGRNSFVYSFIDIGIIGAGTNCSIMAEHCYWGTSSPSSGLFSGTVDWNPYLTSLPSYSPQAPSPENNLYDNTFNRVAIISEEEASEDLTKYYNDQWNLEKKIGFLKYLISLGEAKGVADLCKDIIFENPYSHEAFIALDMVYQISKNEKIKKDFDKDMFKTYLQTFEDSKSNQFLKANAMLLLAGLEKDVALMDKVYIEHKDTYMGKYALQQKFMYYFHETEDMEEARTVLTLMDEVYPDERVTYEAHSLMGDEVMDPREFYAQYFKKDAPESIQLVSTDINEILPEEYALNAAYPNPFNPSTTLEYALPTQSDVKCSIYNVSGNLVKEYSLSQNAGTYSIVWDGSNVSSGIYLIRFTAEAEDGSESFVDYQKVTLLK